MYIYNIVEANLMLFIIIHKYKLDKEKHDISSFSTNRVIKFKELILIPLNQSPNLSLNRTWATISQNTKGLIPLENLLI